MYKKFIPILINSSTSSLENNKPFPLPYKVSGYGAIPSLSEYNSDVHSTFVSSNESTNACNNLVFTYVDVFVLKM